MIYLSALITLITFVTLALWARPVTIGRSMLSVELGPFQIYNHGTVMVANYLEHHLVIMGVVYLNRRVIKNPQNVISIESFKSRKAINRRRWI